MMADRSIRVVRDLLSDHWVIREYRPDYGIDLTVELFEFVDAENTAAATLGETLFVQVKSTEVVELGTLRVYPRGNVERGTTAADRSKSSEIPVARLTLETSELLTVQAMGSAVPVLLFLVELSTGRIYYVCLNDLIEKVVIPEDPSYETKKSKMLHIPARNCIVPGNPASLRPLETYAKRSKLYAAFAKFAYQKHELEYALDSFVDAPSEQAHEETARSAMNLVRHFLPAVLRYDFWTRMPEWALIDCSYRELSALAQALGDPDLHADLPALQAYLLAEPAMKRDVEWVRSLDLASARTEFLNHVRFIWQRLANLARVYEEFGREWFLPTHLSDRHVDI